MLETTVFTGARKIDVDGIVDDFWMVVEGDAIVATGAGRAPDVGTRIDLDGRSVMPGFIDLHCHGGGGFAFEDGDEAIVRALAAHRAHGTTRSVISLVSNPLGTLRSSLATIADLVEADRRVLGAHLEGPFLAATRRGAHDPDHLRHVDAPGLDTLLDAARGCIKQITIAPERPGALDAIDRLVDEGIVVAVGHTEADYDTTREVFDRGATMLTHAFNAMPGIHHRAPGPVVAAFADERVTIELVLDGAHVHPEVARIAFASAAGRVALVTDAMAAAGSCDGDYRLGSLDVSVRAGRATLAGSSTIAGSTLTQDVALRFAITTMGLDPVVAVAALTSTPARALRLDDRFGRLAAGLAADIVVVDGDWRVEQVWAAGQRLDASKA